MKWLSPVSGMGVRTQLTHTDTELVNRAVLNRA